METIVKKPKKRPALLIPLLSIAVVLIVGYKGFGWNTFIKSHFNLAGLSLTGPTVAKEVVVVPDLPPAGLEAWNTFVQYVAYAHANNLEGIKSLSYQISPTCLDATKTTECNALMDNVYNISTIIDPTTFKHMLADEKQMILYTDGPSVAILLFTLDSGQPKVLGMRFCAEDESSSKCIDESKIKQDTNQNGWWDSVESIFYKK